MTSVDTLDMIRIAVETYCNEVRYADVRVIIINGVATVEPYVSYHTD